VEFITVDKVTFQDAVKPMYDDIAKSNPELSKMADRIRDVK
ncbi:TRAP transporter substrate-binding protein, partial [Salmonella enterica subsp. enterica serovar Bareilly]|nr:TRAP transporter substrate-binding protein [Salmonella enterica subsp. enterica serovar Bareilly]